MYNNKEELNLYIKNLFFENYGPIDGLNIDLNFNEDGSPKPIILIGRNGSGKSLVLSQILQAILEFKTKLYDKIPEKEVDQYYKIISTSYIKAGKQEAINCIEFENNVIYSEILSYFPENTLDKGVYTKYLSNNKDFRRDGIDINKTGNLNYDSNVYLFFPSDRTYIPWWRNQETVINSKTEISYRGICNRNIICYSPQNKIDSFLLDIFFDYFLYGKQIFQKDENGMYILDSDGNPTIYYEGENRILISFINSILDKLNIAEGKKVSLYFTDKKERKIGLRIVGEENNSITLIDSLSKLSSGQYSLLSLFMGILMDFNKTKYTSIQNLEDIKGVVIIDEAELNLHIDLQLNVLPALMSLFKNIQFIITTQSPFLVYGIKNLYKNNCDVYEMPLGMKIQNLDDIQEIKNSICAFMINSEHLKKLIETAKERIKNSLMEVIVITEGKTDEIYLKKAMEKLKPNFSKNIDIIGLDSQNDSDFKQTGERALSYLASSYTLIPNTKILLFLFDRDLAPENILKNKFIKRNNNVYKAALPVPSHRSSSPSVCIELYFKDFELTTMDENGHRLYLDSEFDDNGFCEALNLKCEAISSHESDKIKILDGSKNKKVYKADDPEKKNLALSKTRFANYILQEAPNFDNFDFSEFNKIFDLIKLIIDDSNEI